MQRENVIKDYFQAWIDNNVEVIESIFSEDAIYTECYGPQYHGKQQIAKWFSDWNKNGIVLEWKIKKFIHQNSFTIVEWYFLCNYENEVSGFHGVSIIQFNDDIKIIEIKEFQSKSEHYFPYEED